MPRLFLLNIMKKELGFYENEYWYGGAVHYGEVYPIGEGDTFFLDTTVNATPNQLNPVFLSNKGRYIWLESGGSVSFEKGVIKIDAPEAEVCNAGETLRDAALSAARKHYPPTGTMPDKRAFLNPQYCSGRCFCGRRIKKKYSITRGLSSQKALSRAY